MGLCVRVRDFGQGIGADFLPFVFERFAQSDAASNRHRGGLGLGLAIVKQIVDAHGGTISVHSEGAGLGTMFEVWLPIDRQVAVDRSATDVALAQDVADDAEHPLANLTLLIVDDDPDARAMLRIILVDRGAIVMSAASADEAIDLIGAQLPDLLISDIGMPSVDGYELLRRLRGTSKHGDGMHRTARFLPASALTSFTRDVDREQARLAGFDAHCPKPLQPLVLVRQILGLLER